MYAEDVDLLTQTQTLKSKILMPLCFSDDTYNLMQTQANQM